MLIACRPGPRMGTLGLGRCGPIEFDSCLYPGKTGCVMITEGILPKTIVIGVIMKETKEDSEAYRESRSGGKLELLQVAYFQDFH